MNRKKDADCGENASVSLNIICFSGAFAGGFGAHFLLPSMSGIMFIYWCAFVLLIAPQMAIWSDSRRTKMATWSSFGGAVCLLLAFLFILIPFWN